MRTEITGRLVSDANASIWEECCSHPIPYARETDDSLPKESRRCLFSDGIFTLDEPTYPVISTNRALTSSQKHATSPHVHGRRFWLSLIFYRRRDIATGIP
ncbi:hypothetical protein EVAR_10657_1 [Eumeta japonica]|uniref:Uncharacterized protein n=1 Tax=Eumeta variegata TaxID=151549 RepID=A0A4C1U793_EUMVA|nr:hypothetical protein EVAR_10657_1 [Eumeta japonica]